MVLRNRKQAKEIYELKLQALKLQNHQVALENAYLRAKANPHLTYNVLNALYAAVEKHMPEEAKAIKLLSNTIDFAIGRTEADGKISLHDEVKQIEEKIELFQYLNSNEYQISFTDDFSEAQTGLRIPPMVLVTLVDNVFMHGNLKDKKGTVINSKYLDKKVFLYSKEVQLLNYLV